MVAVGGEWGTLSEIGFARKLDRPVVTLRSWSLQPAGGAELEGVVAVEDPAAALEAIRSALNG